MTRKALWRLQPVLCSHLKPFFTLLASQPYRIMALGGQDVNFLDEVHDGRPADILDNAYVLIEFESGSRACLELCMFAEASKHQARKLHSALQ